MNSEYFICSICYSEYNQFERIPKTIPSCGHSFCSNCLQDLISNNSDAVCPIDKKFIGVSNTEELPTNITLSHIIEKRAKQAFCPLHQEEITLVCIKDKQMICSSCEHSLLHQGHQIQHIRKIRGEANKKIKDLESVIEACDKYHREIENLLQNERIAFCDILKGVFITLKKDLEKKETLLLQEIEKYFNEKKVTLNKAIDKEIKLCEDVKKSILRLKSDDIDKEFFTRLEEEIPKVNSRMNYIFLKGFNKVFSPIEYKKKLENFHNSFREELEKFKFPFQHERFVRHLQTNFITGDSVVDSFTHEGAIEFHEEENKIFVSLQSSATKSQIKISRLHEALEMEINLTNYSSISNKKQWTEILIVLGALWESLPKLKRLTLEIQAGPKPHHDLVDLFSSSFWEDKKVKTKVRIVEAVDGSRLAELVSEVLPRISGLKGISFRLEGFNKVTDRNLETLVNYNVAAMKELEYFDFVLDASEITDRGLIKLLSNLSCVKKFKLHLWKAKITNASIDHFAINTLPLMKEIQHFELGLIETEVTDQSVAKLFVTMPHVKVYKLFLGKTKVTEKAMDIFSAYTLPTMGELMSFCLSIAGTGISNDSIYEALRDMKQIEDFKIYLNNGTIVNSKAELQNYSSQHKRSFIARLFD